MSNLNRTIENLGTFPQVVKNAVKSKFCVICKIRVADNFDHIKKWQWGGDNSVDNCGHICTKCHNLKNQDEAKAGTDLAKQEKVTAKWRKRIKTPTGKVETIRKNTENKNAAVAKKITKWQMKFRLAKNEEAKKNCKKNIARLHRENK